MSGKLSIWVVLVFLLVGSFVRAGDAKKEEEYPVKSLQLAPGMEGWVWADEKQIINPVAICIDEKNRIYVAETLRFRIGGGLDNRAILFMFLDDLRMTKMEERTALYEKWKDRFPADFFTKYSERITRFADTTGKGRADQVTVFADGFNHPLDGPCAGLVARNGTVYFTCIPKVYALPDANDDGKADSKEVLFDGFGVRVGISGHDCHGIIFGPDGKLYWSQGDRGYNVNTKEGKNLLGVGTGGIFRCNPDGSDLELYFQNLRNPQEIAFDDYGNLFSCDNNADIGDKARVVYALEGGSAGWHQGWQVLGYSRYADYTGLKTVKPNPWMQEKLYDLRFEDQATWILPPVGHITNGPCGLAYYPGTGLPEKYNNTFFVVDYTAGTNSGVHTFTLEADGAGFKMPKPEKFVWGLPCTDIAFGYDGIAYISDYLGGWHAEQRFKGRIIAVKNNEAQEKQAKVIEEVRKLFADGMFTKLPASELMKLMAHVDQRVRMYSHYELARRGKDGIQALSFTAFNNSDLKARLHGVWGLGMVAREKNALAVKSLTDLLEDKEPRVREQAAKMLGDVRNKEAAGKLTLLLKDDDLRVRSLAAIALGRIGHKEAVPALIDMLRDNGDKDAFVRHSAIQGLTYINDPAQLVAFETDSSRAVRLGVLETYRKLESPRMANFLKDSDALIYAEAIRAIYDKQIPEALKTLGLELKRHLDTETAPAKGKMTELLYHRIIYAAHRHGGPEHAGALAEFGAKSNAPMEHRVLALTLLESWEQPTEVDPAWGQCRPVAKRDKSLIRDAIKGPITWMMSNGKDDILARTISLAIMYGFELKEEMLLASLNDEKASEPLRLEALKRFVEKKDARLKEMAAKLLTDANANLRVAGLDVLLKVDPAAGIAAANEILANKTQRSGTYVLTDKGASGFDALKTGGTSNADIADASKKNGATFTWVKSFGGPHAKGGPEGDTLPRLNDGSVARNNDDVDRCVWFDNNESRILLDLKKTLEIARVNTFSWHSSNRAPQKFTLWGAGGDTLPDPSKDLSKTQGWTKVAEVDTFPLKDSGQHGSSVFNPVATLGKFRYLLWQNGKRPSGTFFTEIDVYEKGQSMPPLEIPANAADLKVKQEALLLLGKSSEAKAGEIVGAWMDELLAGKATPSLHLDILEAADSRTEDAIKERVAKYKKALPEDDKLAPYKVTLQGGDWKKGKDIFEFHGAACLRCHKLSGQGGDAGPNLAGVGKRLPREKILESLIDPGATIVEGFGLITFRLNDGSIVTGSIAKQTQWDVEVKQADGKVVTIKQADIKKKVPPVSPMPTMEGVMKPREMRDLINYLSSQQ